MTQRAHAFFKTETSTGWEQTPEQRLRHDVRQSLGLISALADGVQQNIRHVAEALSHLHQMQREVERTAKLVSTHVATTNGPQRVDVGQVVADTWRSSVAAAPCNMQLLWDAATHAVVDPVALSRSVQNLLDNAVRAAGADGAVVVHVRDDGDSVTVAVSDTGPGFGNVPAQQGLGLITVRRFAAECGGTLDVVPGPMSGATLALRIPAATRRVDGLTCAS
jgi:signal transduction histidine kinase